jgi:MFS family permease
MFQHEEKLDKGKIKLVSFISFLLGFSQAIIIYVMSSYFKLIAGTENVGLFYLVSYVVVLVILINMHKVVRKLGKARIFLFSVLAKIIAAFLLIYFTPSPWCIVFAGFYMIFASVEWTALDIILESCSIDKLSGRIRGLHLTIFNLGFLFGPLISVKLLEKFDFYGIFFTLFFFNIAIFVIALIKLRYVDHCFNRKLGILDVVKRMAKRKEISRIYYISFVLDVFFALMIIYVPIHLTDLGFSWNEIGRAFTVMLIPFVILQYPAGYLADKKWGEKKFLIFSLIIMSASSLVVFFTISKSVVIWAIILFFTRIGAALIEILRDSYFYKEVDARDVDFIDFFRTATPMGYIVATFFSSIVLIFFPTKFAFIIIAIIVASALYPAFLLKEIKFKDVRKD